MGVWRSNKTLGNFLTQIKQLEGDYSDTYDIKKGSVPVILTSAHGIEQKKRGGRIKLAEPFTRGIARYVSKKTGCYYLIKNEDTGMDPNRQNDDDFKAILCDLIEKNHIKMVIDLHGAKKEHNFDVEVGTLNGESADAKIVDKLVEFLRRNGIGNIVVNDPFKGGDIIRTVHDKTGVNCMQLEINRSYRSIHKINNMRKICKALSMFVGNL